MSLFNFSKMKELRESSIKNHIEEYDDEDIMYLFHKESYENKLSSHMDIIREEMNYFNKLNETTNISNINRLNKNDELEYIATNINNILKLSYNIKTVKSTNFISQLADKIMSYTVKNNKDLFCQLKTIKRYLEKSKDKDKFYHEYYMEPLKNKFPFLPKDLINRINSSVQLDNYKTYLTKGLDFSKIEDAYPDWVLKYNDKVLMTKYLDSEGNEIFKGGTYNIRTCVSIIEKYLLIMIKESKDYSYLIKSINNDLIKLNETSLTAQNIAEKMCKTKEDLQIFEENIRQAYHYSQEICIKQLEIYNLSIQSVYIYYKNLIQDIIDQIYDDIPERFRKTGSDKGEF